MLCLISLEIAEPRAILFLGDNEQVSGPRRLPDMISGVVVLCRGM